MAGGLSHIVGGDGLLTLALVETTGDKKEALLSTYNVLAYLIECGFVSEADLRVACAAVRTPAPRRVPLVTAPWWLE